MFQALRDRDRAYRWLHAGPNPACQAWSGPAARHLLSALAAIPAAKSSSLSCGYKEGESPDESFGGGGHP